MKANCSGAVGKIPGRWLRSRPGQFANSRTMTRRTKTNETGIV